jgi:hypothetical protein
VSGTPLVAKREAYVIMQGQLVFLYTWLLTTFSRLAYFNEVLYEVHTAVDHNIFERFLTSWKQQYENEGRANVLEEGYSVDSL